MSAQFRLSPLIFVLLLVFPTVFANDQAISEETKSDDLTETVDDTIAPSHKDELQEVLDEAVEAAADLVDSDPEEEEEEGDQFVVTLTDDNFKDFVAEHERTLVEFYAPWCGHCKALAPKYEEAARILKERESPTALAKVDATDNPAATAGFEIKGYPTLFLLENGMQTPYDGGRETDDIVDWVMDREIVPYDIITGEQFESMKLDEIDLKANPDREFEVFGFVREGSKRDRLFHSLAKELYKESVVKMYKIYRKKGDEYRIVLRRNNRDRFADEQLDGPFEVTYTGRIAPSKKSAKHLFSFKDYDFGTWLQEHMAPFFIDLDAMSPPDGNPQGVHPYSVLYSSPKVPRGGLIVLKVPPKDDPEVADRDDVILKMKEELIDTVKDLRANEGFMVVLTSKVNERIGFDSGVQMLLLQKKVSKIPKLPRDFQSMYSEPNRANPANHLLREHRDGYQQGQGLQETVREYRYQWNGEDVRTLNGKGLRQFVKEAVVDGTATRWIRSKEAVAQLTDEDASKVLYQAIGARDFEEKVLDKGSDVLMLYCAKWNNYCEELMVEYSKLAEHVATYYKGKSIKIMFMDCDENDVDDVRVNALPTMILYPAGTDDMYKGKLLAQQHRTVDEIVDFLDEFAVTLNKDEL